MWITLWIDVDKSWISCGSHAIQLNFSCIILCPLGVSRPLCTQNSQDQHFLPDSVDKSADIVRFLLLCTRLCTMFDISVHHGILGEEQLGSASADAQSYWQGRFAACAFVGGFLGSSHPRNSWGVAPNPTRDRRKGTKSPLDPFSRLSWSRFHAPSACSFWCFA